MIRWLIDEIKRKGLGAVTGRYYGAYLCEVTKNEDKDGLGRIEVYGAIFPGSTKQSNKFNLPIPPKSSYVGSNQGFFFPPEVGSHVMVSFLDGDYGIPYYDGGMWNKVNAAPFASEQTPLPSVRGIKTAQGYEISFHEGKDIQKLCIKTPSGNIIELDDKTDSLQGIKIATAKGHKITMDDEKKSVTVEDLNGNKYLSDETGITITTTKKCTIKAAEALIEADTATIKGGKVTITGGQLTVKGTVSPTGQGPFNGLPMCAFTGAPHSGTIVSGT